MTQGFDAVELDIIKHGDRLGPKLGERVFEALTAHRSASPVQAGIDPLVAETWRDLEIASRASGALSVSMIHLPVENVRAIISERRSQAERIAALEVERDEARKYCSAAATDYSRLLAYLEGAFGETDHPLPFEKAFAAAAKECRETSEFLRWAAEGLAVGYIYDDELSQEKLRTEAAESLLAEAREALEQMSGEKKVADILDEMAGIYPGDIDGSIRAEAAAARKAETPKGENDDA